MRFDLRFQNNKRFHVVGMGLNSVDFLSVVSRYPESNSKTEILRFERSGGGQVATALVALSRWGIRTKYIGKVGSDELGQFSLESIRQVAETGVDFISSGALTHSAPVVDFNMKITMNV